MCPVVHFVGALRRANGVHDCGLPRLPSLRQPHAGATRIASSLTASRATAWATSSLVASGHCQSRTRSAAQQRFARCLCVVVPHVDVREPALFLLRREAWLCGNTAVSTSASAAVALTLLASISAPGPSCRCPEALGMQILVPAMDLQQPLLPRLLRSLR